VEGANAFLNERYIAEFDDKLTIPAKEKGTAFRRTLRTGLNWVLTAQIGCVVAKADTVVIGELRTPHRHRTTRLHDGSVCSVEAVMGEKP
jgi:hypothetical protein